MGNRNCWSSCIFSGDMVSPLLPQLPVIVGWLLIEVGSTGWCSCSIEMWGGCPFGEYISVRFVICSIGGVECGEGCRG